MNRDHRLDLREYITSCLKLTFGIGPTSLFLYRQPLQFNFSVETLSCRPGLLLLLLNHRPTRYLWPYKQKVTSGWSFTSGEFRSINPRRSLVLRLVESVLGVLIVSC